MKVKTEKQLVKKAGLLDGIDLDGFVNVFTAKDGEIIRFKHNADGTSSNDPINKMTEEPYYGCGLTGDNLIRNVLPAIYYNTKISPPKAVNLVGPPGSGKTTIAECLAGNFANADPRNIMKLKNAGWTSGEDGTIAKMIKEKRIPVLRIQNYANILNEDIVGEWDFIKMSRAEKGDDVFNKDEFFRLGALTEGLYKQKDPGYSGRAVVLDEITRSNEETMNLYLESLRERKISVAGKCFGGCDPESRSRLTRFLPISTANEGDQGTTEMSSALQTRLSRVPVEFISPDEEQTLIERTLGDLTENKELIKFIASKVNGVPCLMQSFRGAIKSTDKDQGLIKLTVKPSIKDGTDMAKIFLELGYPPKNSVEKETMIKVATTILGKNAADAKSVENVFARGICGLR
jgi:energy-coupling factor transporter ATP-binding protein EcfA2